jgi:hypothetical protein
MREGIQKEMEGVDADVGGWVWKSLEGSAVNTICPDINCSG